MSCKELVFVFLLFCIYIHICIYIYLARHMCVGSLSSCLNRLSSSLSSDPPPSYLPPPSPPSPSSYAGVLSSPVETILTMCVACAKYARFLFPQIGPIWKQLQISAWNKLTTFFEIYQPVINWREAENNGGACVPFQAVCKTFTTGQSPRSAPIVGWGFSFKGGGAY